MPCYSCGASQLENLAQIPTLHSTPSSPCLRYLGHTFYPLDFVYLIPRDNSSLYDIGQILSFPNSEDIQVLKYERLDEPEGPFSEVCATLIEPAKTLLNGFLEVVLVSTTKVLTLPSERLEGICWAKNYHSMSKDEHAAWCSLPDHFVVHDADLKHGIGSQLHHEFLIREKRFLQLHEPLRGLELFAGTSIFPRLYKRVLINTILGAGGFGTGLGQSGHIKTLWAIEWDEPAASTYRLV